MSDTDPDLEPCPLGTCDGSGVVFTGLDADICLCLTTLPAPEPGLQARILTAIRGARQERP